MFLEIYRQKFEKELASVIEQFGEKSRLRDACEYALFSKGKRLRPLIVMMTADSLSKGLDVTAAALSVEFFHTASLIADDLPCMDNDDMRRNQPSLHKTFGEATALLASYTLIAEGYGGIHRSGERMRENSLHGADEAALLCLATATRCAGIRGATSGQFLDLYPPDSSWETILKVIEQKTVTLFEISFVFGWLFGGGDKMHLKDLQRCAFHLGMAFQIADDLEDVPQDGKNGVNIAALLGKKRAEALFEEQLAAFKNSLEGLGLWTKPFQELYSLLDGSQTLSASFLG